MKRIKMTEFVLEQITELRDYDFKKETLKTLRRIEYYAKFLSQPLQLGMFVPCDEDGNVLENPKIKYGELHANHQIYFNGKHTTYARYLTIYKQAKEKVLFKGFDIHKEYGCAVKDDLMIDEEFCVDNNMTIEDFVNANFGVIELTDNAIKQIGL
ncbi:MAG: hypothetical protein QM642_01915 [Edaphocola sp.]